MEKPNANFVPRTREEMQNLQSDISGVESKKLIDKAHKQNEKVELAKKLVAMFQTEEFKTFWKMIHTDMAEICDGGVRSIRGEPFAKLDQLATIQGGLDMLDSIEIQKQIVEKTAEMEFIKVEELEDKLKTIKQNES